MPDIFYSHNVTPNIERIPGGYAVKCDNEAHARSLFDVYLREDKVKRVEFLVTEHPISFEEWHAAHP